MNDIVRYQLRKPASYVSTNIGVTAIAVNEDLGRLVEGLGKVYSEKNPQIDLAVAPGTRFRGESGDFMEVAGNLLDNACKWCKSAVRMSVEPLPGRRPSSGSMLMTVEDDGPGIPEEAAGELLKRGMRLDESAPGHGIGLAVVKDIASSYGGGVSIDRSPMGGARFRVTIDPGQA